MTEQSTTANAGADESPVVNTNMSVTDFAMRRIGEMTPKAPEQTEPQDQITEETEEQTTEEVNEEIEEVTEGDELAFFPPMTGG